MDKNINKETEKQRILDSFKVYGPPPVFKALIMEALESKEWDWFTDMDGCTGVADYWPTRFHPACLVHDFHWRIGRGGEVSDLIFKDLMEIYSMAKSKATLRFLGVRMAWIFVYKWKHFFDRNIKGYTPAMCDYIRYVNYKNNRK